jgi:hypothetical protein
MLLASCVCERACVLALVDVCATVLVSALAA